MFSSVCVKRCASRTLLTLLACETVHVCASQMSYFVDAQPIGAGGGVEAAIRANHRLGSTRLISIEVQNRGATRGGGRVLGGNRPFLLETEQFISRLIN